MTGAARDPERAHPVALHDEFLAAGALPTLHDRDGLPTDAAVVVATIEAELAGTSTCRAATARAAGPTPPSAWAARRRP